MRRLFRKKITKIKSLNMEYEEKLRNIGRRLQDNIFSHVYGEIMKLLSRIFPLFKK